MNTAVATSDVIGGVSAMGEEAATGLGIMRLTLAGFDRIVLPRKTLMNRRRLWTA